MGSLKEFLRSMSRERALGLGVIGLVALVALAGLVWFVATGNFSKLPASGPHVAAADHVTFTDETLALGVLTEHRQGDDHLTGLDEALGSGACALDYDNDGSMDLFVVNGSGDTRYYGRRHWWQQTAGNSLLRNRGDGHFEDVTATAFASRPMRGYGCVAADFDNDGNTDLLITGIDENILLRNLGNGRFIDVTEKAGLKGYGWQTAAAVADVDGDGLLDIYVGRLIAFQKGAHTYEPGSQYKQDVPASFNSALYPAQPNSLYKNLGGFRFEDVAEKAGVANADGRTLGAMWLDLDGDHRPDLIVQNAAGTGSAAVFHNDGKWRFTALGYDTRLQVASGVRAAALGDLDNDGVPEILMTATNGAQSGIFVRTNSPSSSRPSYNDRARQWHFASDAYSGFSPWSALTADFNNDGWLDVFVANGLVTPDPDVPRLTVGQPKQLWLNSRRGELRAQSFAAADPLLDRQSARGAVAADFDNDGDIDLYVTHNNDLGQLLINQSAAGPHWSGLRLVNRRGNRDAVGAEIELSGADGKQYRWITSSNGFLSGSDPRVHFGLGSSSIINKVVVTWPDGDRSTFRDLPADQYITLERGKRPVLLQALGHTSGSNYASLTHGREPALRADYIRLLVEARGFDASIGEVRDSLADRDVAVRKASVEVLGAHPGAASLAVLLDAFADADAQVVGAAADAVCHYEDEAAIRWLLRLFAHSSASVRAAAANCFSFYFSQQEGARAAVVHRKYLAVPYLVTLLADQDESVQIAAVRALGFAERFRGVPPLLDLAGHTLSAKLRAEAVRAVGVIRDKQGTPALVAMLADRKRQAEPATVAQLLIALKRLDYSALPTTLADFAAGRGVFATMPVSARLAVMQDLLASEDGVVLARSDVAALARRSYAKAAESPTADEATVLSLIDVLSASSSVDMTPVLTSLARNGKTAAIKASALKALIRVDAARASAYVQQGLNASDTEVGRRLLQGIVGTHVDIPDRELLAALGREDVRANVLMVVRQLRSAAAVQAVFGIASDRAAPVKTRTAAVEALTRSTGKVSLPSDLYATEDAPLATAVVRYDFSRLPELYVSRQPPPLVERLLGMRSAAVKLATIDALTERQEFWARARVLTVLKDSNAPELRAHILDLMARNALEGTQVLETIATNKTDPLRLEAMRHLEGREGSSAEQLLLSVLHDVNEDPRARIIAAHRLVGRLGAQVLEVLEPAT